MVDAVDFLNRVHSHFDDLVDRYRLEKVRTMGDSYMVASRVPHFQPEHTKALARMAPDMRVYAAHPDGEQDLQFRCESGECKLIKGRGMIKSWWFVGMS